MKWLTAVFILFCQYETNAQVSRRMKDQLDSAGTNKWNTHFATISGGFNYALLDRNAKGIRAEIEYSQSWHKHFGGTINVWYTRGIAKEVLVWSDYGQRITKDGKNSGFGIDPSFDISFFKNRMHDITLQSGINFGRAVMEEWRVDYDRRFNPPKLFAYRVDKPVFVYNWFLKLAYNIRFDRIALGLNLLNLNFNDLGGNYYGVRLGYVINKPFLRIGK